MTFLIGPAALAAWAWVIFRATGTAFVVLADPTRRAIRISDANAWLALTLLIATVRVFAPELFINWAITIRRDLYAPLGHIFIGHSLAPVVITWAWRFLSLRFLRRHVTLPAFAVIGDP